MHSLIIYILAFVTSLQAVDGLYSQYISDDYGVTFPYPSAMTEVRQVAETVILGTKDKSVTVITSLSCRPDYLPDVMKTEVNKRMKNGQIVTYKRSKYDWYVISGFDGESIFYTKKYLTDRNFLQEVTISYPKSERGFWDKATKEITAGTKVNTDYADHSKIGVLCTAKEDNSVVTLRGSLHNMSMTYPNDRKVTSYILRLHDPIIINVTIDEHEERVDKPYWISIKEVQVLGGDIDAFDGKAVIVIGEIFQGMHISHVRDRTMVDATIYETYGPS